MDKTLIHGLHDVIAANKNNGNANLMVHTLALFAKSINNAPQHLRGLTIGQLSTIEIAAEFVFTATSISLEDLSEIQAVSNTILAQIPDRLSETQSAILTQIAQTSYPECTSNDDCTDENECTNEICSDGACVSHNNTDPCDDSDFCTESDFCLDGWCVGTPIVCTLGECIEGVCQETGGENGTPCDDGDPCTENDVYLNGYCEGTPIVCAFGECIEGVCIE